MTFEAFLREKRYKSHQSFRTGEALEIIEYAEEWHQQEVNKQKDMPSVEELSQVTIDLVEKAFPKEECKERGAAIVLHAEMLIAIHELLKVHR